jgi:hypothetical protein
MSNFRLCKYDGVEACKFLMKIYNGKFKDKEEQTKSFLKQFEYFTIMSWRHLSCDIVSKCSCDDENNESCSHDQGLWLKTKEDANLEIVHSFLSKIIGSFKTELYFDTLCHEEEDIGCSIHYNLSAGLYDFVAECCCSGVDYSCALKGSEQSWKSSEGIFHCKVDDNDSDSIDYLIQSSSKFKHTSVVIGNGKVSLCGGDLMSLQKEVDGCIEMVAHDRDNPVIYVNEVGLFNGMLPNLQAVMHLQECGINVGRLHGSAVVSWVNGKGETTSIPPTYLEKILRKQPLWTKKRKLK